MVSSDPRKSSLTDVQVSGVQQIDSPSLVPVRETTGAPGSEPESIAEDKQETE